MVASRDSFPEARPVAALHPRAEVNDHVADLVGVSVLAKQQVSVHYGACPHARREGHVDEVLNVWIPVDVLPPGCCHTVVGYVEPLSFFRQRFGQREYPRWGVRRADDHPAFQIQRAYASYAYFFVAPSGRISLLQRRPHGIGCRPELSPIHDRTILGGQYCPGPSPSNVDAQYHGVSAR